MSKKQSLVLNPRGITFDVHLQTRFISPLLFYLLVINESGVLDCCAHMIIYKNEMLN